MMLARPIKGRISFKIGGLAELPEVLALEQAEC
jgi:hypothetical protein